MLIALTILSIALTIAWPSQKNYFQLSTARLTGSQLFQAVQIARSQSLLQSKKIILCHSVDQQTCSGEWRDGYIIKMDNKILNSSLFTSKDGVIYWQHFPYYRESLEFLPNGFSNVENGTFYFCMNAKINPVWAIVVNQAGRARLQYPDREGKIYNGQRELLRC